MEKRLMLAIAVATMAHFCFAQQQPYKVVFDLTSRDTVMHQRVIRWLNLIVKTNTNPELEVVFYGQSLAMVTKDKSCVAEQVIELATNSHVRFVVCEEAMKVHSINKDQLLPGVATVPDGIYQIIVRQGQGYGYIKATQ